MDEAGRWGWLSDFPTFTGAQPRVVRLRLQSFVRGASPEQIRAWDDSIPWLQRECSEVVRNDAQASAYTAILEYELPREARRPDVIVLENGVVVVLELKGKAGASQADIDQVSAYARDLRCYHRECADRPVHPVLVPSGAPAQVQQQDDVLVVGPEGVHDVLLSCTREPGPRPLLPQEFLRPDAYAPLPSLVKAARDLFRHDPLPKIKRASTATDPAVERITEIAHEAACTRTRRLVLLTGVPGAGKTLVGLRLVHAGFLDDLARPRAGGRPSAPAVFLSGNRALVSVLQDALRGVGGGGKVFVQNLKDYLKTHSRASRPVPDEHLLVFDEAQRAWDRAQVARWYKTRDPVAAAGKSEPEQFLDFSTRIPDWCVVVALIGGGQEIHAGEESGLVQWRAAIEQLPERGAWTVHAPAALEAVFEGSEIATCWEPTLNLDTGIRQHGTTRLHELVAHVLAGGAVDAAREIAAEVHRSGYRLWVTRDLAHAKAYIRDRYAEDPEARYGLVASVRDKDLLRFDVTGRPKGRKRLDVANWFNAAPSDPRSCCGLALVASEFDVQGLELELALLAWGSDYVRREGAWVVERLVKPRTKPQDPVGMRRNAYRVLLTRGRDGTVVFVPRDGWFDETYDFLRASGFRDLLPPSP